MFLAQLGYESSELRHVQEVASGSAYEGRRDVGNSEPGDGPRFTPR
jgi:putative chitinase